MVLASGAPRVAQTTTPGASRLAQTTTPGVPRLAQTTTPGASGHGRRGRAPSRKGYLLLMVFLTCGVMRTASRSLKCFLHKPLALTSHSVTRPTTQWVRPQGEVAPLL